MENTLCDCEYAEKHEGMDKSMELASVMEKLAMDNVTSLVRGTDKLVLNDASVVHGRQPKKKYNYENCSCFNIEHIDDLCELCVRSCRRQARWTYLERKEEEREKREGTMEEA